MSTAIVVQSLIVALASAVSAVSVGLTLVWLADELQCVGSRWISGIVSLMVLVPNYVVAGAWSAGFGALGTWPLSPVFAAQSHAWGIFCVVWIHTMAAIPIAFWLLRIGYWRLPREPISLAYLDGGLLTVVRHGVLPNYLPWLVWVILFIMATVSNDMLITNLFQITTVTEFAYLSRIAGEGSIQETIVCCSIALSIGFATAMISRSFPSRWHATNQINDQSTIQSSIVSTNDFSKHSIMATLIGWFICSVVVLIPVTNLIIKLGWHPVEQADGSLARLWSAGQAFNSIVKTPTEFATEFYWSGLLSISSATISLAIALAIVSSLSKVNSKIISAPSFLFQFIALTAIALPGPIVNQFVRQLMDIPALGLGWLDGHSLMAPILCLQFRLLPIGCFLVLFLRQSWNARYAMVSEMDRSLPILVRATVAFKSFGSSICLGWCMLMAIAFGDLASYLLCLPPGATTVSMRIFELLHYGVRYRESGLLIWLVIAGAFLGFWLCRFSIREFDKKA